MIYLTLLEIDVEIKVAGAWNVFVSSSFAPFPPSIDLRISNTALPDQSVLQGPTAADDESRTVHLR